MAIDVELLFRRVLDTQFGAWEEYLFRSGSKDITIVCHGGWREVERPLARLHSSCVSAHYLASVECDCREQLEIAYFRIREAGAGIVVHVDEDGRGNGHLAIMRAAVLAKETGCTQGAAYETLGYPADARTYGEAVAAVSALGVRRLALMTNNPSKSAAFAAGGIDVQMVGIVAEDSPHSSLQRYYQLKALEGHLTGGSRSK